MGNLKHTKGKWKRRIDRHRTIYIANSNDVLICELDNHPTIGFVQATPEAIYHNTKLIEAAPDLLDTLKRVVEELSIKQGDFTVGVKDCISDDLTLTMLNVINKATK